MRITSLILALGLLVASCDDRSDQLAELSEKASALTPATDVVKWSGDNRALRHDLSIELEPMPMDPASVEARKKARRRVLPGEIAPKEIIGSDDRTLVSNTTNFPYRRVVKLYSYWEDPPGSGTYVEGWCSGVIIQETTDPGPPPVDKSWVLTASHCIYDTSLNGFIVGAAAIPALNGLSDCGWPDTDDPGTTCPYGTLWVEWATVLTDDPLGAPEWDVALMRLTAAFPPQVGVAGWKIATREELEANTLYTAGYPGDLPPSPPEDQGTFMYAANDGVDLATWGLIWNWVDVMGGQSGSGYWQSDELVVGFVTGSVNFGGLIINRGVRLRRELIGWMHEEFGHCTNECFYSTCVNSSTNQECVLNASDNCLDLGAQFACGAGQTCANGECVPKGLCDFCYGNSECPANGFCLVYPVPQGTNPFCTQPCASAPPHCPPGYVCADLGSGFNPPYQCLPGATVISDEDICAYCTPSECPCTGDNLECTDLAECTGTETCVGGECVPGTPVICDDSVACTADLCVETFPGTECQFTPDDGYCDDGVYCDGTEVCHLTNGCQEGTPVSCGDGVGCTIDVCNENTDQCDNTPNHAACDDGAYCNGAETCDAVSDCQDGTDVNCNDGVGCTNDICNDTLDRCQNIADNSNCDNGLYCDGLETCHLTNDCQQGTAPDCNDGVACTVDSCDEGNDVCVNTPSDVSCNDGQYCNGTETCHPVNGCQGGTPVNCNDGVACTLDSCDEVDDTCDHLPNNNACSDGNVCTNDVCDVLLGCQYSDNDGVVCTMGSCTGVCAAGLCEGCVCTNDAECDDGVACTLDTCNASGICNRVPSDAACDDGAYCNGVESCDPVLDCQDGVAVDCDDGVDCTDDSCDESVDDCLNATNNLNCSDGDFCNGTEVCDAVLGCQDGPNPNCNDGNPCTDDTCDATAGCQYTNNDDACDDGDDCTMDDVCAGGSCAGEPLDADDDGYVSDACQGNDCDDQNAEVNPGAFEGGPDTAPCLDSVDNDCDGLTDDEEVACADCVEDADCEDGNACNGTETCDNGECRAGTPLNCNDGNICTQDNCEPASGCVYQNRPGVCDDGDDCTVNDACTDGECLGDPLDADDDGHVAAECGGDDCDDSDAGVNPDVFEGGEDSLVCTDGIDNDCDDLIDDEELSCTSCTVDADCDDGNPCNGDETCDAGNCAPADAPLDCNDGNICTDDDCNTSFGCEYTNNTAACDDSDSCTENDVCSQGACIGDPIDADGDGESPENCGGTDCDDTNAAVNSAATENCSDLIDNDCDGDADEADSECEGAASSSGCTCSVPGRRAGALGLTCLLGLLLIRRRR